MKTFANSLFTLTVYCYFQPGKELFPKDDAGNVIYADINPIDTWKVY